jgi:mannose-1-phosphate guanylyltransferase/mannose-6-phosphate isomerase
MNRTTSVLIPTILCGGVGTRLWPLSRDSYPKQLLPLTSEKTMLQATAGRMIEFKHSKIELSKIPLIVCNEEHRFLIAEQIKGSGCEKAAIILEPLGRNTAPALTVAALQATGNGQNPLLLVMPADHVLTDISAFHQALATSLQAALSGAIVTFGIVPKAAETGYGYIQANYEAPISEQIFPIIRFVEKPDGKTAQSYLAAGGYYWNSGMFFMQAKTWLNVMKQLHPVMLDACIAAFANGEKSSDFLRLDRAAFAACPSDSIDYAVMERLSSLSEPATKGIVVPLDAGWSDVGAWDAVWQNGKKDNHGNSIQGDVLLEDAESSLVMSTSRLVACVGIKGLAVIETPDAILVAQNDKVQDVQQIVKNLKAKNRKEGSIHRKVYRPWGWYDSLEKGERFQVKRIAVNPGAILSLQLHNQRSEHWIIIKGTAKVTLGDKTIVLKENQSIFIPVGEKHRAENPGQGILELIEIQLGSYLGEDDIIRLDDLYGRS